MPSFDDSLPSTRKISQWRIVNQATSREYYELKIGIFILKAWADGLYRIFVGEQKIVEKKVESASIHGVKLAAEDDLRDILTTACDEFGLRTLQPHVMNLDCVP